MVSNLNLLESRRRILLNIPHIETISDTIASFKTDVATKLKGCKIHFTPIQEGEGDPSPENVRPIHGWDGVTITMPKGKNLLISDDPNNPNVKYYHSSTGSIKYSEEENGFYSDGEGVGYTAHAVKNGISSRLFIAPANMTITFSIEYKNVGTSYGIRFFINNKRLFDIHGSADKIWHKFSHTITMQKDDYIYLMMYKNIYWRNMQIEIGSVASDYEEYIEPSTITIPFSQTIYGGYVDLVNGEVVEEYGNIDLSTVNFQQYGNTGHCWSRNSISGMKLGRDFESGELFCDAYKASSKKSILSNGEDLGLWPYNTGGTRLIIRNDSYIDENGVYDIEAFHTSLSGVMAYYPLATPISYPIDPQTLKTLRGMNNIWSDANGNVEVSFYTR